MQRGELLRDLQLRWEGVLQLLAEGLRLLHALRVLRIGSLAHTGDEGANGKGGGERQRQEGPGETYQPVGDVDEEEQPGEEGEDAGEGEDEGGHLLEEEVGGGEEAGRACSGDDHSAEGEEACPRGGEGG